MLNLNFHALVWKEAKLFVAKCLEIEVASQGKSRREALVNLKEALELYLEDEKPKKVPSQILFNQPKLETISFRV